MFVRKPGPTYRPNASVPKLNAHASKDAAQNTKGWRQELETCGGRALKCSLEKCEPKYEVKRRYANEKCLGVPAQVVFRRVSRSVLDWFPGNLTCQPKWCTAVRSKAAGAARKQS